MIPASIAAGGMSSALEIADDQVLVLLGAGREREAAVPHHRSDAVVAGRRAERVPEDLRVHVRVAVDDPGGDNVSLGIDHLRRAFADAADRRDFSVLHTDVGAIAEQA